MHGTYPQVGVLDVCIDLPHEAHAATARAPKCITRCPPAVIHPPNTVRQQQRYHESRERAYDPHHIGVAVIVLGEHGGMETHVPPCGLSGVPELDWGVERRAAAYVWRMTAVADGLQQISAYLVDEDCSKEEINANAVRNEDRHWEGESVEEVARRAKPTAQAICPASDLTKHPSRHIQIYYYGQGTSSLLQAYASQTLDRCSLHDACLIA